jgi:hypothetical protein
MIIGINRRIEGLKRLSFNQQRIITDEKRRGAGITRHPNG